MATDLRARDRLGPSVSPFVALTAVAGLAVVTLATSVGNVEEAMRGFPWQIVAMYVALEGFAGLVAATGATDLVALRLARASKARRRGMLIAFAILLFVIGGFVNNLTDMVMILPIAMVMLRAVGIDQRFVGSFFAMLLAVSNLAGAATPIGDFPAILILGSGLTTFGSYLAGAFPLFLLTAIVLVTVYCGINRSRRVADAASRDFAVRLLEAQYRHRKLDRPALVRLVFVFVGMFIAWMLVPATTAPPEVIAWAGFSIASLLVSPMVERAQMHAFDLRPVLSIAAFLFGASLLVTTGFTEWLAANLELWFQDPRVLVLALMVTTSLMCGVVSAGPAAAAMLPVVQALAAPGSPLHGESDLLAVAFAASICAGSSLFLFSATAGLMLASKVGTAGLVSDDGSTIRFGIRAYLPYGVLNYAVQMVVAVTWVMLAL